MALSFSRSSGQSAADQASKRNFARPLVGDLALELDRVLHRPKLFLPRNMTRVLAYHEKQRVRRAHSNDSARRTSSRTSLRNNSIVGNDVKPATNGTLSGAATETSFPSSLPNHVSKTPESQTTTNMASSRTPTAKQASDTPDAGHRRSARHRFGKQYEEENAQLVIRLKNMRKKLNFKENRPIDGQPPKKRRRKGIIECHVHLCIWNNSPGLDRSDPIIRKTEVCEIIPPDSIADSPTGIFVDMKMSKPLVINSQDLKIPIQEKNETRLGFAASYFMELKIIPIRSDVQDWPPVPLLGKSEGDQTTGLSTLAAEKLQGALVARYQHLPQAPDGDTPLLLFYLHQGRTYRTKYGMEVSSIWTKDHPSSVADDESDEAVEPWVLDDLHRPFGRELTPVKKKEEEKPIIEERPPKIIFYMDPAKAKGTPKDFRKSSIRGYFCPICTSPQFKDLSNLHFHLTSSHHKYRFVIDESTIDPTTGQLTSTTVKVESLEVSRPRNLGSNNVDVDEWQWHAPSEPFDMQKYNEGDYTWLGIQSKKKNIVGAPFIITRTDPLSDLRKQNGGFLSAKNVPEFREDRRKTYPNVRLATQSKAQSIPYTSISHRQIVDGEDNRSETDDEMDNEWFVEKYLESLDITAKEKQLSEEERVLRKKWARHLFLERQPHSRYLSDSFVRFVKQHLRWLVTGNDQLRLALLDILEEMEEKGMINEAVVRDIGILLGQSTNVKALKEEEPEPVIEREEEVTNRLTCWQCYGPIRNGGTRAVRCTDMNCQAPGRWYHAKCIGCEHFQRYTWKCEECRTRKEKQRPT